MSRLLVIVLLCARIGAENATVERADIDHIELIRSPRQTRVQVHLSPHTMTVLRPPPAATVLRPFRSPPLLVEQTLTSPEPYQSTRNHVQFTLQDSISSAPSHFLGQHSQPFVPPDSQFLHQNPLVTSTPLYSTNKYHTNTNHYNPPNTNIFSQPVLRQVSPFPQQAPPQQTYRWQDYSSSSSNQQPVNVSLYSQYPYFNNQAKPAETVKYSSSYLSGSGQTNGLVQDQYAKKPAAFPNVKTTATLKEVLNQDCPDAEEYGFCSSPPRYPSHQVSQVIRQCRELLQALYVPLPAKERANSEVWSWANSSSAACASDAARLLPGYVRDAVQGRWLVVVQAAGQVVQPVSVDVCRAAHKPCSGITKCNRSGSFRHAYKASRCVQRYGYQHLVTWDPDTPAACPRLTVARFPTSCVCQLDV